MSQITRPKTQYASVGDASVAYQTFGEGALDVVFIPGFVSNVEYYWQTPRIPRILERFASYARTTIWDKRGTGLSDPMLETPTIDDRMDDLLAVIDAAEIERAALFGVSEGGPLSLLFAATYPDRVSSLALYGAAARYTRTDGYNYGWPIGSFNSTKLFNELRDGWADGAMIEVWAPSMAGDPAAREMWGDFLRHGASPAMGVQTLRAAENIDVRDILPSIQTPTLLIHRAGDRAVEAGCSRYMAEHIPNSRYVELPGEDHLWFAGDTDSVFDEVERFLVGAPQNTAADRVLATVMVTDIVDSTKRAAELGDAEWRALVDQHDELTRRALERFRGREVKTLGDGFLATFDGPARAVACADQVRGNVRSLGLEIRAGLHTGECEITGDDVIGMAVNIAARVSAEADPGEVLVSSTVKDLVFGSNLQFEERGTTELKGVPGEWRLFASA